MHERRRVLEGLDEIRGERLLEQDGHCAMGVEVARKNRLPIAGVADDDASDALLEVVERGREAEDRHDLGGDDDVEPVLTRKAIAGAAEADGDIAQRPVVHVDDALPGDAPHVDVEDVAVVDVVVDEGREQVVRERDGAEVTGEVQVDVLHRDDLRVAAAGGPALHPEDRAERWLAQADHRVLADGTQAVAEAHARRGLALARGSRADRGDEDELGRRIRGEAVKIGERHLRLVVAVWLDEVVGDAK